MNGYTRDVAEDIRVAAFVDHQPVSAWVTEGMQCCTYSNLMGGLNGYVRLPGEHPDLIVALAAAALGPCPYDEIEIWVHGGWTYGPDEEYWIGFDTMHAGDIWSPEDRLRLAWPESLRLVNFVITMEMDHPTPPSSWDRHWTQEQVEAETRTAAQALSIRMQALRMELRRRREMKTDA